MNLKIGIDVGGTFTDFFYVRKGQAPVIHKVLSTPEDPSLAVVRGLEELAKIGDSPLSASEFIASIETIVHGTTVTTNTTLTRTGAKSGLITTQGVRDALEMRRGIREEQYNNRYTNVEPLVPRYLRIGVEGRLDRNGQEITPLNLDEVRQAIELFKEESVEAVSICFMNAFANPEHEQQAAELVRKELPNAYLSVSTDLLPSIRFYERVSTTALNSYVGPKLDWYLNQLKDRLQKAGFSGLLLIMQSNGGVMTPELARKSAAQTLLSGPSSGPGAGLVYAKIHGQSKCIVVDMGGTSFEAALVVDSPIVANSGKIDRHHLALPMLDIHTIGAGGGSIGWIDKGGLLRMGPQSAGADPGPACYQKAGTSGAGGRLPTTTDANLILGFLNPDFFAGGQIRLDMDAARKAVEEHIAKPLGMDIERAAAGMYRIACTNMAQGVREISIKRGFDPREFPLVVAGGAGPIHSCLICDELEIPFQIIPRESSILCAVGMLMSDIKHDFIRTFVARLENLDWEKLESLVAEMEDNGRRLLSDEGIPEEQQENVIKFDCRYLKQYHEVSFPVPREAFRMRDLEQIIKAFHAEHNRLYGYTLEAEGAAIEIINVRVQAIGQTEKPQPHEETTGTADPSEALKGKRQIYVFENENFEEIPVFDGHRLRSGHRISGPAMIEQITTAIFVSKAFDCLCDPYGSLALFRKGSED
ncbi:MAG: hydantoinase/oxoprolinase family protein [SAR324 cluster bacterium]|nr:hydantoinase/oxoprolinase family protein [SAR324 cluster bacterium]